MKLSKDALFAHVGYAPHEGQRLVHASRASRRVLCCGSRWGKSTLGSMEALAALLAPCKDSIGWIVAPNFETSELIFGMAVRTMREHFAHRIVTCTSRELVVLNLGGGRSELRAKTAEDPNGLVGAALDWVILDEAARLAPRIWDNHISQRLVDRNGWALMLSTPRGCNWFRSQWRLGQQGRDPRYASWSSPAWANPHVDRGVIEAERASLTEDAFAQEYEAKFLGEEIEPCERCGGPHPYAAGVIVIDDEEPPVCSECGGLVHDDGRTAVGLENGKPTTMIIRVYTRKCKPPELPV